MKCSDRPRRGERESNGPASRIRYLHDGFESVVVIVQEIQVGLSCSKTKLKVSIYFSPTWLRELTGPTLQFSSHLDGCTMKSTVLQPSPSLLPRIMSKKR